MNPDENLTADELAQFDAMRTSDQPDASPVESAVPETPAPPASATPEASPDAADPAKAAEVKPPQTVPHQALHQERAEHKATKTELARLREEKRVLEDRTNLILERFVQPQPPQPAAPEIPDFATDPAGNILGRLEKLGVTTEQFERFIATQQQQTEQQRAIANLEQVGTISAQRFKTETPDYDAAIGHMLRVRDRQLEIQGYPPLERRAQLKREEWDIIQRHGEDAAQKAYELATETFGYAPKPADPVPAPTAATALNTDAAEKLERVQAGQQQARSLGGARGNAPSAIPPAQRILEMSGAKFDELMDKASPEDLRDIFGH